MPAKSRARVVIVGGGFGGIAVAKSLARADVDITLLDRKNHHVFQPLLYQVATAALSPADISSPIRTILRGQANCEVALATVRGVDMEEHRVLVQDGYIEYDVLVLAAGATHAYFGHDEWAPLAPGLKSVEDATEIRRRILLAFEAAEYEDDEPARRAALTFAVVGAGPTGVELAGAIKEIAAKTLPRDYKHIDTRTTRVILFEGADRVLPPFPEQLSLRAQRDLERIGVEVRTGSIVSDISGDGVLVGDKFFPVNNVFWAAGVKASSVGASLGVPLDRAGRVIVGPDLSVPGHPDVFVIGDMAAAQSNSNGEPVPGVAQGAIQMGRFVGATISTEALRGTNAKPRGAFSYRDKGMLAIVGKSRAVASIGRANVGGFGAWLLWGGVHIAFLVGFRNRLTVLARWFWKWLLNAHDARLITGTAHLDIEAPRLFVRDGIPSKQADQSCAPHRESEPADATL